MVTLLLTMSALLLTTAPVLACIPARWTGGGTIDTAAIIPAGGVKVTHGFEFHTTEGPFPGPYPIPGPNNFEVNWGGNHFHLTQLSWTDDVMNPLLPLPDPPTAPVNEVYGLGVGQLNGVDGATIYFHLTDVGEPGKNDFAHIEIWVPGANRNTATPILLVEGNLKSGNQQAHPTNK